MVNFFKNQTTGRKFDSVISARKLIKDAKSIKEAQNMVKILVTGYNFAYDVNTKKVRIVNDKLANKLNKQADIYFEIQQQKQINNAFKKVLKKNNVKTANVTIDGTFNVMVYHGKNVEVTYDVLNESEYRQFVYRSKQEYDAKIDTIIRSLFDRVRSELYRSVLIDKNFKPSDDPYDQEYKVSKINENELLKHTKDPINYFMKSASVTAYKFINGVNNECAKIDGQCVPEFIVQLYKNKIPTLTIDKVIDIMLTEEEKLTKAVFKKSGYTATHIGRFCDRYKISCWLLDWDGNVFFKKSYPKSSYRALMAYCMSDHMYVVNDKKVLEHIVKSNVSKNTKSINNLIEQDQYDEYDAKNVERFKLPFFEDVDINNLNDYKDCNIFYHDFTLYYLWVELFVRDDTQYKCKFIGKDLYRIEYDNNVMLYANNNHKFKLDWNDSLKVCKELGFNYTGQNIQRIAQDIFKSFHIRGNRKCLRKILDRTYRKKIFKEEHKKCNSCKVKCQFKDIEIDHVLALSNGGDNSRDNLQVLCKTCHDHKSNREAGEKLFNIDGITSSYNKQTKDVFSNAKSALKRSYDNKKRGYKRIGLDINKCRRNILLNNKDNFCVFSVLDDFVTFNSDTMSKIPVGFYIIKTNNFVPFNGDGLYSHPMVRYGLEEKIIKLSDIQYYLKPSLELNADYFKKFIMYIVENVKDEGVCKLMINAFIGTLGSKMTIKTESKLTKSLQDVSYQYFNKEGLIIRKHNVDAIMNNKFLAKDKECNTIFEVSTRKMTKNDDSTTPIFNQILDMEAIEIHKMKKTLESLGGEIVHINTDCVVAQYPKKQTVEKKLISHKKNVESEIKNIIDNTFWDDDRTIRKYKEEHKIIGRFCEKDNDFSFELKNPEYEIINDPLNNDFDDFAKKLIALGKSFQVQGRAGTGKSTLMHSIIKYLKANDKSYIALAPTNVACRVLDSEAMTLHSFMACIRGSYSRFDNVEYIIIDEKSMIKELFYRMLYTLKNNVKCKFIVTGDFDQLPPVCDRCDTFDYENSSALHSICDGVKVELTKCRRADKKLFDLCANVNDVVKSEFTREDICKRSIAYHNSVRKRINMGWMDHHVKSLKKDDYLFCEKYSHDKQSQDMFIYKGLPVIASVNNKGLDFCNSEEFTVDKFSADTITITDGDRYIDVQSKVFTKMFHPAYCITCHRVQGRTITTDYSIMEWDYMDDVCKYVALSRARSCKQISIF